MDGSAKEEEIDLIYPHVSSQITNNTMPHAASISRVRSTS